MFIPCSVVYNDFQQLDLVAQTILHVTLTTQKAHCFTLSASRLLLNPNWYVVAEKLRKSALAEAWLGLRLVMHL
jgi:hypothetical protein